MLFPLLLHNLGNKHQNNPLGSVQTFQHDSAYIILFLTQYDVAINDNQIDDFHISSCLNWSVYILVMTSQLCNAGDNVTINL